MKNMLFVAAMLATATLSKGADSVHLADMPSNLQAPAPRFQPVHAASFNGMAAGILLLGVSGFLIARFWRRYRMQATEILQLQQALTENSRQNAVKAVSFRLSLVRDLVTSPQPKGDVQQSAGVSALTLKLPISGRFFSDHEAKDDGSALPIKTLGDPGAVDRSPDTHHSKDSILIVEDNTDMREYLAAILRDQHYTVFTATNGEEGLKLILSQSPSLVLSDLMMPKMNGIEMTRHIKQNERTSHIPVILLTAKNEVESKLDGLKIGADDYLTKPFLPEELLVRIGNLIEQRKKLGKLRERILVNPTPTTEMSLDARFLNKARTVVESNLTDCNFTVEKMADEMHLSRTQLLRKLKALTGLSPNDFIKDMRLKRAADMINRKTDTITQIGFAVGFNDQSYFTKCFKKQFGVTPSEFSVQATARREGV